MESAHLKDVGEIAVKNDGELKINRPLAVIAQPQPLVDVATPNKRGANDVQSILFQHELIVDEGIRIGQVDSQN